MKVAVLYLEGGTIADVYPDDFAGRDTCQTVFEVADVIRGLGHETILVNTDLDAFEKLRAMKPDVAFNLCDDGFDNDSSKEPHVAAMLDVLGIPYTGNGYLALATCLDKVHTKELLCQNGLPTPKFHVALTEDDLNHDLKYPVIVKPSREDGSIGIKDDSVAQNAEHLKKIVKRVLDTYDQPALIEEYINGREFNVAVVGNDEPVALPVSEIKFEGLPENQRITSYTAKWIEDSPQYKGTVPQCPADIDKGFAAQLQDISKKAYKLLGLRGYGRVDIRANGHGPYILEVNPNPDIDKDAGLFRSAKAAGMTYSDLIAKVLEFATENKRNGAS